MYNLQNVNVLLRFTLADLSNLFTSTFSKRGVVISNLTLTVNPIICFKTNARAFTELLLLL